MVVRARLRYGRFRVPSPEGLVLKTLSDVDITSYDFLDLGCGIGGSLESAAHRFGGRGLGVDNDPDKVREAQAAGRSVVLGDITALQIEQEVAFVSLDNVLEHLPSLDAVRATLDNAARAATDFIYIRHPSFEDEWYLRHLGLKQYWTDWSGHPMHLTLSDLAWLLRELELGRWEVSPVWLARDSNHPTVVPASAPRNSQKYDQELHGDKPSTAFERRVWYAFDIIIPIRDNDPSFVYPEDPIEHDVRPRLRKSPGPTDRSSDLRRGRSSALREGIRKLFRSGP